MWHYSFHPYPNRNPKTNPNSSASSTAMPQVQQRLELLESQGAGPEVVIVGAGYAGIELAAVLGERLKGRGRLNIITAGGWVVVGMCV